jgi:hypothetical protein
MKIIYLLDLNLNLNASSCMQEIRTTKLIKDLEKKFDESLRNLSLLDEVKEFKTQKEKLEDDEVNKKITITNIELNKDKEKEKEIPNKQNKLEEFANHLSNNNDLDLFKIEPLKDNNNFMITSIKSKQINNDNPFGEKEMKTFAIWDNKNINSSINVSKNPIKNLDTEIKENINSNLQLIDLIKNENNEINYTKKDLDLIFNKSKNNEEKENMDIIKITRAKNNFNKIRGIVLGTDIQNEIENKKESSFIDLFTKNKKQFKERFKEGLSVIDINENKSLLSLPNQFLNKDVSFDKTNTENNNENNLNKNYKYDNKEMMINQDKNKNSGKENDMEKNEKIKGEKFENKLKNKNLSNREVKHI